MENSCKSCSKNCGVYKYCFNCKDEKITKSNNVCSCGSSYDSQNGKYKKCYKCLLKSKIDKCLCGANYDSQNGKYLSCYKCLMINKEKRNKTYKPDNSPKKTSKNSTSSNDSETTQPTQPIDRTKQYYKGDDIEELLNQLHRE